MTILEAMIMTAAMEQIGQPYIWKGKGDYLWDMPKPFVHSFGTKVFDCSGLVTHAMKIAGLKDTTMHHSAQTLYDKLKSLRGGSSVYLEAHPAFAFYGRGTQEITHVGILLSLYGNSMMLDAGGGDGTTDTLQKAEAREAKVRLMPPLRTDLIGVRMFPESDADL